MAPLTGSPLITFLLSQDDTNAKPIVWSTVMSSEPIIPGINAVFSFSEGDIELNIPAYHNVLMINTTRIVNNNNVVLTKVFIFVCTFLGYNIILFTY